MNRWRGKRTTALALLILALAGCRPDSVPKNEAAAPAPKDDQSRKVVALGSTKIGKESIEFYIAYAPDAAVLGFSVVSNDGGGAEPARYFPLYASTHRGIPPVTLDVFASKSEDPEMWVRSSWKDSETLAYRKAGAGTAITQFGETKSLPDPMPSHLSGGPIPFPPLAMDTAVKKASFKHDEQH